MSSVITANTVVGWAIIGGILVGVYYVSNKKPAQGHRLAISKSTPKSVEKKKEAKKSKTARKDDRQSSDVKEAGQKQKVENTNVGIDASRDEEEISNREFAKQLSQAKAGTLMPAKSQDGGRQRSIKQARAQEKPVAGETSSENGTAGADADDDRSSANSPELGATPVGTQVPSGDVSDMLEPKASGPSVLRVTAPTNPTKSKKAKPAASTEIAETKKQRQNKKKAEEAKLQREADEKVRKQNEEKQRKAAREAEGRPAKDGSKFMASNIWSGSAAQTNGSQLSDTPKAALLDTYTPQSSTTQESTQSGSDVTGSDWLQVAQNMSEEEQEEQIRRLDEPVWETVATKDKRSKKKAPQASEHAPQPTKSEISNENIKASAPAQKWSNAVAVKEAEVNAFEPETEVQDSEWEVA